MKILVVLTSHDHLARLVRRPATTSDILRNPHDELAERARQCSTSTCPCPEVATGS